MINRKWKIGVPLLAICCVLVTAAVWALARDTAIPVESVRIVETYPHDVRAFTQGLAIEKGRLFESTGLYGQSTVREVDLATGKVLRSVPLADTLFGEGMTILDGELFIVTWKARTGYVLDPDTFEVKRAFKYGGEGWGLTHDGTHLILSDGSAHLRFLDPQTAEVVRRVHVRDGDRSIERLNELEYVNGQILANIWYEDRIARIDPQTGQVRGWIDASPLRAQVTLTDPKEHVLNGIAYDPEKKALYLTGKFWPKLFHVSLPDLDRRK